MAVETTSAQLDRAQAKEWIEERGIERLPARDEQLEYTPAGTYNSYVLERADDGFSLTSHILVGQS